jgi:hypothetical protein
MRLERQIATLRSRMIQQSLTSFTLRSESSLGRQSASGSIPGFIEFHGTEHARYHQTNLFYGCVLLIAEARLALRSVKAEMEFTLRLSARYGALPGSSSEVKKRQQCDRPVRGAHQERMGRLANSTPEG